MHLVAGNFIDLTTEKLLVPALPQLAVLAMIEVVGIQEDKVHVVGIGSKEVLALVIDRLESNPKFLEHRASTSRIVRVPVDCDEVDIRGLAEYRNDTRSDEIKSEPQYI